MVPASWPIDQCGQLEILARERSARRFLDLDDRFNRQTDQEGSVGRVTVDQVDADRQPLHHFDEVARGVFRGQRAVECARPRAETGDSAAV